MSKDWKTRTQLVHEGSRRSQYGEMAEAIFLTQGFAYDTAESAEARFVKAGEDEFIYARYGNPTTRMFEERIAAIEGTEDAFATASGMAAVNGALVSMLKAGDHVVSARALFVTTALNPKALTSWLAILGLFPIARADAGDVALLCAGACLLSFSIHTGYTLAFSTPAAAKAYLRAGWVLQAIAGVLFTGFALRLVAGA